ncbi:MAG: acylphosphatase [Patescibacteria group bacterium]|nr:acylphosphatase [Patescibacteria group bacterium]
MTTAHVVISGFVQGIGYRQFVRKEAEKLGLKGFVQNIEGGKVEALFQGDKKNIEKIIDECKKGPYLSEIKKVDIEWVDEMDEFPGFEIIS